MALKPVIGKFNAPQSLLQLTRGRGWNSELTGFLLPFARQDFIYFEDDFTADTLDATFWATAETAGATAITSFAQGSLESGTIRGDTGTDDNAAIALYWAGCAVFMDAARNPGTEIRFKSDVVTNFSYEIAISDAKTDEALPAVTDVDTPATGNGVTDIVCLHADTDQTLKTLALVSDGTTDAAASALIGTFMPTAATYTRHLIQVFSTAAFGIVDNNLALSAGLSTGPDTAILMRPSFLFRTRSTAQKTLDIDYVRLWAERY